MRGVAAGCDPYMLSGFDSKSFIRNVCEIIDKSLRVRSTYLL